MIIGDHMNRQVACVSTLTSVQEAARVVVEKRVSTLPVIDEQGVLIGVVRISDMLKVFMPVFVTLVDNIDFVHDFGVLETLQSKDILEVERLTVKDIMPPPVAVGESG